MHSQSGMPPGETILGQIVQSSQGFRATSCWVALHQPAMSPSRGRHGLRPVCCHVQWFDGGSAASLLAMMSPELSSWPGERSCSGIGWEQVWTGTAMTHCSKWRPWPLVDISDGMSRRLSRPRLDELNKICATRSARQVCQGGCNIPTGTLWEKILDTVVDTFPVCLGNERAKEVSGRSTTVVKLSKDAVEVRLFCLVITT
jgi:hypothetical protein